MLFISINISTQTFGLLAMITGTTMPLDTSEEPSLYITASTKALMAQNPRAATTPLDHMIIY